MHRGNHSGPQQMSMGAADYGRWRAAAARPSDAAWRVAVCWRRGPLPPISGAARVAADASGREAAEESVCRRLEVLGMPIHWLSLPTEAAMERHHRMLRLLADRRIATVQVAVAVGTNGPFTVPAARKGANGVIIPSLVISSNAGAAYAHPCGRDANSKG